MVSSWGGVSCPTMIFPPPDRQWRTVAAGDNHSLAIAGDGSLWAWGRNDLSQLGFHTILGAFGVAAGKREAAPVQVGSGRDWAAVSGGMLFSVALKRDRTLWGWGGNWTGQLAEGQTRLLQDFNPPFKSLPRVSSPTRIGADADWAAIAAGAEHVLALKRDGTLWAWGRNDCSQLGIGNFEGTNSIVRVGRDRDWVAFSAGGAGRYGGHSAAIKRNGSLWVW